MAIHPAKASSEGTYKVTITNLTGGQPMTPFVVATHSGSFGAFTSGSAASAGIQAIAENGGVPVLVGELSSNPKVFDVAVAGGAPVAPGATVSTFVDSDSGIRKLTIVSMLICTNDGFGGVNSLQLNASGSQTVYGFAYDAGTEINTEDYDDV